VTTLEQHAAALADGIETALPAWVERSVERVLRAWGGEVDSDRVRTAARSAGERARDEVMPQIRQLLAADVDAQHGNPLALLRAAVSYPTAVLRDAGVPPLVRDEHQERLFPDDVYDLAPANFGDVDPALAEVGMAWGAAKAFEHLQRHKVEQ